MKNQIGRKIVSSHERALEPWAALRADLPEAPRLISFDYHTDTCKPFRRHLAGVSTEEGELIRNQWLKEINYKKPDTLNKYLRYLNHDEHIVTAINCNIVSSAFIASQGAYDTDIEIYKEHKICCYNAQRSDLSGAKIEGHMKNQWARTHCIGDTNSDFPNLCDHVIESSFLNGFVGKINLMLGRSGEPLLFELPFILDIDLDYFNTFKSIKPKDEAVFLLLVSRAALVTIARESECVLGCAIDKDLTSDWLLKELVILLDKARI